MSDQRNFIARVVSQPEDGELAFIGIHNTYEPKDFKGGKLPFGAGVIANSAQDAVEKIARLNRGQTRDMYVCLGTLGAYIEKKNRNNGEVRYVPDRNRSNIKRKKALHIDTDFKGGDKGYASQEEAEAALAKFLVDTSLPPPSIIVHTGGGFHIYWVLSRALSVDEWQPLADQLCEATRQHSFKNDTNVIVDATRILRVPDTFNHKYNPPRLVRVHTWTEQDYTPEELEPVLSKYTVVTPRVITSDPDLKAFIGAKPFTSFQSTDELTELGAGVTSPPIDLSEARKECGFIDHALLSNGKDYDNTLWNMTTLLATFTSQGRQAAHDMSSGHVGYVKDDTDKLYDRKEIERGRGVGWPRCSTIKAAGCTICGSCKHLSKGLYPFSFIGYQAPAAAQPNAVFVPPIKQDVLPPGYIRDKTGLIYTVLTDKEGNNSPMMPSPSTVMYDGYLTMNTVCTLHFTAQMAAHVDPIKVSLPYAAIQAETTHSMTEVLSHAGVSANKQAMKDFLMAWVDKLRLSRATLSQQPPYGWAFDKDKNVLGFCYAGTLYAGDETMTAGRGDAEIERQYSAHGDLDEWKKAALLVTNTKRPAMDAILAASFAGPLVYFTGEQGLYFSVFSQVSGIGKTTAMRVATSVWADPNLSMQRLKDTINSVQEKMGQLRHLSIFWDELKGIENLKQMAQMVFDLTSGKGKSRLNTTITQREVLTWTTMLITASNDSLSDYLNDLAKNNDAGFYRLFELEARDTTIGKVSTADAAALRVLVNGNYGVAGQLYAQFLGKYHGRIKEMMLQQMDKFQAEFNTTQTERYWLNIAVCLCLGAHYANALGLTQIDVPALKQALFDQILSMRGTVDEQPLATTPETVTDILLHYLRENHKRIMQTTDIWDTMGRPMANSITLVYPQKLDMIDGPVGQFSHNTRVLRLATRPLEEWLRRKEISRSNFTRVLKDKLGAKHLQKKGIGAGVPGAHGGQQAVFDIPCNTGSDMDAFVLDAIGPQTNVVAFAKP